MLSMIINLLISQLHKTDWSNQMEKIRLVL